MSPRSPLVHGHVAPGFEGVRRAFEHNFSARRELGAAVAVHHRGQLVVDLWGGHLDKSRKTPWERDTVTTVFSTTKGVSALAMALAHSRGYFEWDDPVARHWPEFAQAGKAEITLRQLLAHQAGLSAVDTPLDPALLGDPDRLAEVLAAQRPSWEPGTRHGYHAITLGFYQSELIRRTDPAGRSLSRFFREEIAEPLEVDFQIGLPSDFSLERLAPIHPVPPATVPFRLRGPNKMPARMILQILNPRSHTGRAVGNPRMRSPADLNRRADLRSVEIPSGNGIGNARSLARLYGAFATGGEALGLRKETLDSLTEEPTPPRDGVRDLVLHTDTLYAHGFTRPRPTFDYASSPRAFGTPGAGGSFAFADPDARLGYAYVMNRMGVHLVDDPREKALRDATYRAIAKVGPGH